MKKTKRKAFNFMRSYFDVLNKLQTDEDKLSFLMAIINKQFLNEDPEVLKFPVDLAYESQINAIHSSVKGWLRASNTDLQGKTQDTLPTPSRGKTITHPKEEEEEEKGEVEEEEKVKEKVKSNNELVKLEFLNQSEMFFEQKARILKSDIHRIKKEAENFWLNNYEGSKDKLSYNDVKRHFGHSVDKMDLNKQTSSSGRHMIAAELNDAPVDNSKVRVFGKKL